VPGRGDDWAAQTADTIETVVGTVRSKTTEPVERVGRIIVYGLVATMLGIAALVLLAVFLVRIVNVYLPGDVWAAHLTVGGIFTVSGLLFWRKRSA
jgi:hypothetical protein